MRIVAVAVALLACALGPVRAEEARAVDLDALVVQLGHPVYEERLDARRRLTLQGLAAFEVLREARTDPDPEIADACDRLLNTMAEGLARPDDPPSVRKWMTVYGARESIDRLKVIGALASLPGEQAIPALVRLARFAPTDRGAREAARAVLAMPDDRPSARRQEAIAAAVNEMNRSYGVGYRPAAEWLEVAEAEATGAGSTTVADRWRKQVDDELVKLGAGGRETSLEVIATLQWRWLHAALAEGDTQGAKSAIHELVSLGEDDAIVRLSRAARWAANAERWAVVDAAVAAHQALLTGKRGLYLLADLAERRGDAAEAERLAAEALAADVDENNVTVQDVLLGPRVTVARELYEIRRIEWCIAEYQAASESPDPIDGRAAVAAWKLANLLFDAQRYDEAAGALAPITTAIAKSRSAKGEYMQLPQLRTNPPLLPQSGTLIARQKFSLALAARANNNAKAERAALSQAITEDPNDADVLIAMYRVPDPPAAFAADTKRRITAKRRDFESDVWKRPTDADPFNQWAWLVANTEGDFEKAVRYSRRSLEIEPETAGYLDTLGRCLFSAGRIEEAVATQRRAVELDPRMLVLQRQLAEFEAVFAERNQEGSQ